jgi:hypothetical protein
MMLEWNDFCDDGEVGFVADQREAVRQGLRVALRNFRWDLDIKTLFWQPSPTQATPIRDRIRGAANTCRTGLTVSRLSRRAARGQHTPHPP